MNKRQRKKTSLSAGAVKEIASMQNRIDDLENALWRLAMMTEGRDDCRSLLKFAGNDEMVSIAIDKLFDFIEKHTSKRND